MSTATVSKFAVNRAKALVEKGKFVIGTRYSGSSDYVIAPDYVEDGYFYGWRTQALNFMVSLLGERHTYVESFKEHCQHPYPSHAETGTGILQALVEDLEEGYLIDWTELVHANTFADFMEMAEYLLKDGGYKDAAAVMAGGTLEAHLRNLCEKHGIDTYRTTREGPVPKRADALNADLAREEVYSKLDQKSVTAWLDLRNNAAHGHYDAYNSDQVAFMIQGIRDFITRLPA